VRLKGKAAIITGAASGTGRASVLRFLEEGAKVAASDIDGKGLDETLRLGGQINSGLIGFHADLTDEDAAKSLVEKAAGEFGFINVLFNNAGIVHIAALHETALEDWEKVFAVNVTSMYFTCKYALPLMIPRKDGVIINTASPGLPSGLRNIPACAAAGGAISALTRGIAVDYAPYNIRANFICPGNILTELTEKIIQVWNKPGEYSEQFQGIRTSGRFGDPAEIAAAAVFLASDETAFMTGASIVADGGFSGSPG
jgi:NAD(P)-dependent dehydrogenase (short-subunit alcohol dehydrogenase family)